MLVVGSQLSQFVGAAVGELAFLRSIWLDISRRLMWLEDYAASVDARSDGVAAGPADPRHPVRPRVLPLPRQRPAGPRRRQPRPARPGAVVAIVGDNGAGKTTLVKLLARMYDPDEGRIDVDGTDLASMSVPAWRERLAGAFQDFFRFELRALDSVGLGDLGRLGERRRGHRRRRPRRRDRRRRAPPAGPGHPARAVLGQRRRGVVRAVAEAGAGPRLHARRAAAARPRRAHGRAGRRDRARAVRAVRRRGPRSRRPTGG